jgi:hypothetical protein
MDRLLRLSAPTNRLIERYRPLAAPVLETPIVACIGKQNSESPRPRPAPARASAQAVTEIIATHRQAEAAPRAV